MTVVAALAIAACSPTWRHVDRATLVASCRRSRSRAAGARPGAQPPRAGAGGSRRTEPNHGRAPEISAATSNTAGAKLIFALSRADERSHDVVNVFDQSCCCKRLSRIVYDADLVDAQVSKDVAPRRGLMVGPPADRKAL